MATPLLIALAAVFALGVFLAYASLALVRPLPAEEEPARPAPYLVPQVQASPTARDRVSRPFQYVADQRSRRSLRKGGLTLAEELGRADLKLRAAEFVMIQAAFLAGGALIGLLRFGFSPQFVVAGVAGYLLPMRYIRHRQRKRQRALSAQLPDTVSLLSNALRAG